MDLELKGRTAIVTAASRGLGKATALELAREGARIVMCARGDSLEPAARSIREETGAEVIAIRADVSVPPDVERLVQSALGELGNIDILVINAGGPKAGGFLDLTPADWHEATQLTLMSAVHLCYAVVPHMIERGAGSILAIESYTVKQPLDNLILSNALRLGVIGMLKSMANELGPFGIRVNSINPTFTWTERVESLLGRRAETHGTTLEQEAARVKASIPLRRMGDVAEFGRAAAWLASPAASFIHGHALMFDGGLTASPL